MSLPLAPGRRWRQDPATGIYIIGNAFDEEEGAAATGAATNGGAGAAASISGACVCEREGQRVRGRPGDLTHTGAPRTPSVSSEVAGGSSHDQPDEEECSSASSSYCEHSNADKLVQLLVDFAAAHDNILDLKDALRTEKEKVFDGSSRASSSEVSSLTSQSGRLGKKERNELEKELERMRELRERERELRLQAERAHARELEERERAHARELQELRRTLEKLSLENKASATKENSLTNMQPSPASDPAIAVPETTHESALGSALGSAHESTRGPGRGADDGTAHDTSHDTTLGESAGMAEA